MVEMMLDFMLGPLRGISAFYINHQMIFNGVIIGGVFLKIFMKKKQNQT
ncbi:hypothetical protein [Terribacillus halophilus]|jgi:hypothetical protein|nr:hypothetical protein [Terribacillus halophilus]